jgi:hypothetical protein
MPWWLVLEVLVCEQLSVLLKLGSRLLASPSCFPPVRIQSLLREVSMLLSGI